MESLKRVPKKESSMLRKGNYDRFMKNIYVDVQYNVIELKIFAKED